MTDEVSLSVDCNSQLLSVQRVVDIIAGVSVTVYRSVVV